MKYLFFLICFILSLSSFSLKAQEASSKAMVHLSRADNFLKQRNYQGAILEYDNAIRLEPNNYQFWVMKAQVYTTNKDVRNAIKCFEKVIELKDDYAKAYVSLHKLYMQERNTDKAIAALDQACQYESDQKLKATYRNEIIKILYKEELFSKAGKHIQELLALTPDNPNALYYSAKYNNLTNNYDGAIRNVQDILTIIGTVEEPEKAAKFYYELGYAYHKKGDYKNADENLKKADYGIYKAKIFQLSPAYYYAVAFAYYKIYEIQACEQVLDVALNMNKDFSSAHDLKIKIERQKNDQNSVLEALKSSTNAEKDVEKKLKKMTDVVEMLYLGGKYEEATKFVNEALKIANANPQILYLKGLIEHKLNRHQAAITIIDELSNRSGLNQDLKAQMNFTLGLIYDKMGNSDKLAQKAYEKANFGIYKYAAIEKLEKGK